MPDEFDTKVRTFSTVLPVGATSSVISAVFTNSLLHGSDDFQPSGSQNPSLAAIGRNYSKYRVVSYRIDYTISPRSTNDCNMTVFHVPTATTFTSASGWSQSSATSDKARYLLVPSSSKSPCIVHGSSGYSLMALVGSTEYQQDDKYAGTMDASGIPTSPTDLTYAYFYTGQVSAGAFAASTSPSLMVMLTQYVKFYDKRY